MNMDAQPSSPVEIKVLILTKDTKIEQHVKFVLKHSYWNNLVTITFEDLSEAADHLEQNPNQLQLIIFEHLSSSLSLLKTFLALAQETPAIMIASEPKLQETVRSFEFPPAFIHRNELEQKLSEVVQSLAKDGKIPPFGETDDRDYVPMSHGSILQNRPLNFDLYVRLGGEGRFIKIFNQSSVIELADLEKYNKTNSPRFFFAKQSQLLSANQEQLKRLESLQKQQPLPLQEARKEYDTSASIVRDVVNQLGFTPEAQALAKSCVSMSLKALGTKPKLAVILRDLKRKEGDYLVNHSFMLGQVACALAQKIGWTSTKTFFRLSLAAFLHDISLDREDLAKIETLEEVKDHPEFSSIDLLNIKLHPIKSADYSRQFSEIPSDVDTILIQHHERPDGEGFPKKLSSKLVSPLSALFIMAHDLVNQMYKEPETNADLFFLVNSERYQSGQFRKILLALRDPPATKK